MSDYLLLPEAISDQFEQLPIDQLTLVSLDEQLHPGHMSQEVWDALAHDARFSSLIHGARVYLSRNNPGTSEAAIAREQGFREAIGFVVLGLAQSTVAEAADAVLHDTPPPASPEQAA